MAISLGSVEAYYNVGSLFESGTDANDNESPGFKKDEVMAFKYFLKAADMV